MTFKLFHLESDYFLNILLDSIISTVPLFAREVIQLQFDTSQKEWRWRVRMKEVEAEVSWNDIFIYIIKNNNGKPNTN